MSFAVRETNTTNNSFRQDEIRAMNADASGFTASDEARSDFRRGEILDQNAAAAEEARGRQMTMWGVGLVAVILIGVLSNHHRSR